MAAGLAGFVDSLTWLFLRMRSHHPLMLTLAVSRACALTDIKWHGFDAALRDFVDPGLCNCAWLSFSGYAKRFSRCPVWHARNHMSSILDSADASMFSV